MSSPVKPTSEKYQVERALRSVGGDDAPKDEAFAVLYRDGCNILVRKLRKNYVKAEDIEDIVQTVFSRIYRNWNNLRFESLDAWYGYLHLAAANGVRSLPTRAVTSEEVEIADSQPDAYEVLRNHFEAETMTSIADQVWLETPALVDRLQVLAAQLLLIDGYPLSSVRSLLMHRREISSDEELRSWINIEWVVRKASFGSLHWTNDCLAAHILGIPNGGEVELDWLSKSSRNHPHDEIALNEWTWGEVEFILYRYRAGMTLTTAISRARGSLTKERALEIHARCLTMFPFESLMKGIWSNAETLSCRTNALGENLIWKRLTFEYRTSNCLQQEDIVDRISPPAAVAGYQIHNINSWIADRLANDVRRWRSRNQ